MISRRAVNYLAGFVLALSLSYCCIAATQDAGSLGQLRSTYLDETRKQDVTIGGVGTVVQIGDEYFVLTSSHVSQGSKDLEFSIAGKKVPLTDDRLANLISDIELIRIDHTKISGIQPLAVWDQKSERFIVRDSFNSKSLGPEIQVAKSHSMYFPSWLDPKAAPASWKLKQQTAPSGVTDLNAAKDAGVLSMNALGTSYVGDVSIIPGMSGSPLFGWEIMEGPDGKKHAKRVIRGIAKTFLRDYERSQYTSDAEIANLVKLYATGKRNKVRDGRWRISNCLSFREIEGSIVEVSLTKGQAGGKASPAGGGTGGDGGGGTGGDGGEGCPKPQSSQAAFKQYPIEPGMQWEHKKNVVVVQPLWKKHLYETPPLIVANMEALEFTERYSELFEMHPIPFEKVPIGSYIYHKLLTSPKTAELGDPFSCVITFSSNQNGFEVQVRVPTKKVLFVQRHDTLKFKIDPLGRVNGANEFLPVVDIKGNSGQTYKIDLTGLFAVDLGLMISPESYRTEFSKRGSNFVPIQNFGKEAHILIRGDSGRRDSTLICGVNVGKLGMQLIKATQAAGPLYTTSSCMNEAEHSSKELIEFEQKFKELKSLLEKPLLEGDSEAKQ